MYGELLYPGVRYFVLLQPMPGLPVDSLVSICDADGRECLFAAGVEMDIETAGRHPDWFRPVYQEESSRVFREKVVEYGMREYGLSQERAEQIMESMCREDEAEPAKNISYGE